MVQRDNGPGRILVAIHRVAILFLIYVVALAPGTSWSQNSASAEEPATVHTLPGSALGDSSRAFVPGSGADAFDSPFRTNTERPLSMYLAKNTRLFGYEF